MMKKHKMAHHRKSWNTFNKELYFSSADVQIIYGKSMGNVPLSSFAVRVPVLKMESQLNLLLGPVICIGLLTMV